MPTCIVGSVKFHCTDPTFPDCVIASGIVSDASMPGVAVQSSIASTSCVRPLPLRRFRMAAAAPGPGYARSSSST